MSSPLAILSHGVWPTLPLSIVLVNQSSPLTWMDRSEVDGGTAETERENGWKIRGDRSRIMAQCCCLWVLVLILRRLKTTSERS